MKKISEMLKEEREKKNLSFEQIEKSIRIRKSFLQAIEEGRFTDLPSESYALGFVKNYARFLGISREKSAALFRREYKEEKQEIVPEFRKNNINVSNRSILNSKTILAGLVFVIIFVFIFFQYNSLLFGPPLSVSSPKNNQTIKNNIVEIKGKTEPYSVVFVDGEEVLVGIDGGFKKSIYVFPGDRKITITAKNRFGKEKSEIFEVKVE